MRDLVASDDEIVVWTLTLVELISATWRREPLLYNDVERATAAVLVVTADNTWPKISDLRSVVATSHGISRRHRLRAGDSIQLSAALLASQGDPSNLPFVTLDRELASAAAAEGFPVLP
jgi:predicted nucleic acid-binding protein